MSAATAGIVGDALAAASDALAAAGVESPRLDAEILLAAATGVDRASLAAGPERGVPAPDARRFGEMMRRRIAREPVAYILARKGFRHLVLRVDGRALIPRPETELLVELALELAPASAVDIGTGSGAVALSVAHELSATEVTATDTSPAALELARENAAALGLTERVRFEAGSLPAGLRVDLLVANLPYVSEREWASLEPELTRWEPREALVSGPTGLEAIDALLAALAIRAERPAAIALEVGAGQAEAVSELVRRTGYEQVEARRDLAGTDRVVVGR